MATVITLSSYSGDYLHANHESLHGNYYRNHRAGTVTNEGQLEQMKGIAHYNLVITGGQFHQISGHHTQIQGRHHTNLVINLNQSTSGNRSGSPTGPLPSNEAHYINLAPSSGHSTHRPRTELNQDDPQVSSQNQEITLQKSNDIYERHLLPKGRGFPLWIPAPNQSLHIDYRRTGIRIGDVGIITDDGAFSFLFNICLPRDDPVNPRLLPDHFSPISPPIEASDIEKFPVNDYHLASASIKGSQSNAATSIDFESSASEGAILTMPLGARSERLGNSAKFREYAAANVVDWYKFVNGPRGREAKNGDVRLVVGFHKATSWGIATFANQTQQNNCRLKFGPSEGAGSTNYTWEYSGIAEVRAGPDSKENVDLRRDSEPPDIRFENQCLFVRTLNITLTDDVWTDIHSSLGSVHVKSQYPHVKDYSDSSRSHSSNQGIGSSSNFSPSQGEQYGNQRVPGSFYGLEDDVLASDNNPTMFISGPPQSLAAHPSKVLNDILLAKVPTAKMVITHDDDWTSVVTQYDNLPDPHELSIENILASRDICEENGVIFLQPKEIPNEILEDSASVNRVQGSPSDPFQLTKHPKYYILGGDLFFVVENVMFRVHRYFFERESKFFVSILTSPTPSSPGQQLQGTQDSNAILLNNVTAEEFATFLWVFYNPRYSIYDATVADWEVILKLSDFWDFPEVKNLAIHELEKKDIPDAKRIKLYHENQVDKNILIPRYAALCEREAHLTIEEGQDLGMETVVMIMACRGEARAARLASGGRSPLTPTVSGTELHDVVREIFHIEPPSDKKATTGDLSSTPTDTSLNQDPTGKKACDADDIDTNPTADESKKPKKSKWQHGGGEKK